MKNVYLVLLLVTVTYTTFSQNNPRPSRSRFWNSKMSTFTIKPSDVLVYAINNNGENYNYTVTVNSFGSAIDYSFNATEKNIAGNVNINSTDVTKGTKYETNYMGNSKPTFWLSKNTFKELETEKQTKIDLGNGMQTFVRSNNSTMKINYKGKEKIITLYNIQSQGEGNKIRLGILSEANNPLIVSMTNGYTITLKEVR